MASNVYSTTGNYTWTVPPGVTTVTVELWGGGGGGSGGNATLSGCGGGGGAFAQLTNYSVTEGATHNITVGNGGAGGALNANGVNATISIFRHSNNANAAYAAPGARGVRPAAAANSLGGTTAASLGNTTYAGGNGANRNGSNGLHAGSGGGGAGNGAGGSAGANTLNAAGGTGGGGGNNGGNGGYAALNAAGTTGTQPGGGGAGGGVANQVGRAGGVGRIVITYTVNPRTLSDEFEATTVTDVPSVTLQRLFVNQFEQVTTNSLNATVSLPIGGTTLNINVNDSTTVRDSVGSFPSTIILDNFNRGDGALGSNWTDFSAESLGYFNVGSQCAITASLGVTGAAADYWDTTLFDTDCEVYATIASLPDITYAASVMLLRETGIGSVSTLDGYTVNAIRLSGTDEIRIGRLDNAVKTDIATFYQELSANCAIGLRKKGTTLEAWYKAPAGSWTLLGSYVDSTYQSDRFYLGISTNDISTVFDDFGGGNISTDGIKLAQLKIDKSEQVTTNSVNQTVTLPTLKISKSESVSVTEGFGTLTEVISDNTGTFNSLTANHSGTEDNSIAGGANSGTNRGGADTFYCDVDSAAHQHGLLKFTGLSNIPSNAVVSSVTIGLYKSGGVGTPTIAFRRLLRDWIEGTQVNNTHTNDNPDSSCWDDYGSGNAWTTGGALGDGTDRVASASATMSIGSTGTWCTVTDSSGQLLTDVQNFINGTYSNYGWHLHASLFYTDFTSSEGTNNQRPYISVTYSVPSININAATPRSVNVFDQATTNSINQTINISTGVSNLTINVFDQTTVTETKTLSSLTNTYFSVSPFGTTDIKTGSPNVTITNGVAYLTQIVDSQLTGTTPSSVAFGGGRAQQFQLSENTQVVSVDVYVEDSGGYGDLQVAIYSNSGSETPLTELASGTLNCTQISSYAYYTVVLNTPYTCQANTKYHIVAYAINNAGAAFNWYYATDDPKSGLNSSYYGGSWIINSGGDAGVDRRYRINGIAASDTGQTGNIGQGCRLVYDSFNHVCFISKVLSPTQFEVVGSRGWAVENHTTIEVSAIAHCYSSLSAAVSGVDDDYLGTADLTAINVVLNICCYYDHDDYTADTTTTTISGYTGDSTRYINIYTPTGGTQSINRQRHYGKWSNRKYRLDISSGSGIALLSSGIKVRGLQVSISSNTEYRTAIWSNEWNSDIHEISYNIIKSSVSGNQNYGIAYFGIAANNVTIYNNIIYGFTHTTDGYGIYINLSSARVFHNTIYNCRRGITSGGGNIIAKNNLIQSCLVTCYAGNFHAGSTNNLASDDTAPGLVPQNSKTVNFVDLANKDFHLDGTDISARWMGSNLTFGDFPVTDDIDGTARHTWSEAYDIGADEAAHFVYYSVGQNTSDHKSNAVASLISYTEANRDTHVWVGRSGLSWDYVSQGFTPASEIIVTSIKLYLLRTGLTSGDIVLTLHNDDGGGDSDGSTNIGTVTKPITDLANDATYHWVEFTFSSPVTIDAALHHIVLTAPYTDTSNGIQWGMDSTPSYSGGEAQTCATINGSYASLSQDAIFDIWGNSNPNVTISSGIATFDTAQTATNLGVGDKVTTAGHTYFLLRKISTTQWYVIDVAGNRPSDHASESVTSIAHCFASLNLAEVGAGGASYLTTENLLTNDNVLCIPCYYDSGADTTPTTIVNWTTGPNNFIKIYTPVSALTECNLRQRHSGVWDNSKYRIEPTLEAYALCAGEYLNTQNDVRIFGLQVTRSTYNGSYLYGIRNEGTRGYTAYNIVRCLGPQTSSSGGIVTGAGCENPNYVYNNIVYDFTGTGNFGINMSGDYGIRYSSPVYNNTVHNCTIGIGGESCLLKNNIAQDCTTCYSFWEGGANTNNCDDDGTAPATERHTGEVAFFNEDGDDFRLSGADTVARGHGTDLSNDEYLAITDDIMGNVRS